VTNLITPRALFSPTHLLNLVQLEIAPFDPPTSKTPPQDQTRSQSDDPPPRYRHLNFPRWRLSRHLGYGRTGNSAIRSADPENPIIEPNMKWTGRPLADIWPFEIFPNERSVADRSVNQYRGPIRLLTLISYTPLRYVRNVAREEQKTENTKYYLVGVIDVVVSERIAARLGEVSEYNQTGRARQ